MLADTNRFPSLRNSFVDALAILTSATPPSAVPVSLWSRASQRLACGGHESGRIHRHATTARTVKETGTNLAVMVPAAPTGPATAPAMPQSLLVGRITGRDGRSATSWSARLHPQRRRDLELMRSTVTHGFVRGFNTIKFRQTGRCQCRQAYLGACVAMQFVAPNLDIVAKSGHRSAKLVLIQDPMAWRRGLS